jgi:hypothetical protein
MVTSLWTPVIDCRAVICSPVAVDMIGMSLRSDIITR